MKVTAKLIKKATNDGLIEFQDYVPLGSEYLIDTDTIYVAVMQHRPTGRFHVKLMVTDNTLGGDLPLECLDWPTKSKDVQPHEIIVAQALTLDQMKEEDRKYDISALRVARPVWDHEGKFGQEIWKDERGVFKGPNIPCISPSKKEDLN